MEKISVGTSREGYMGNNPEEFPNADVCNLEIVHPCNHGFKRAVETPHRVSRAVYRSV
jgi:hypothetical protein